jgi:peptide-methionine (S)-S-oxide reductase
MNDGKTEIATLGGGCFWCLDTIFRELRGVTRVESGYAGGTTRNPKYKEVCSGLTGHAEVTRITFDPSVISYRDLLDVFFTIHDPTTLNRQGGDRGAQYRSVIFYHSDDQRQTAEAVIKELTEKQVWDDPIVTELEPVPEYFPAETYHQDYYSQNPDQGYCQVVIAPKVAKFRKLHLDRLARR